MSPESKIILVINGGSSSIKYAIYNIDSSPELKLYGKIDRIGLTGSVLTVRDTATNQKKSCPAKAANMGEAAGSLIDWLEQQKEFSKLTAIGHRIVHGMNHTQAEL